MSASPEPVEKPPVSIFWRVTLLVGGLCLFTLALGLARFFYDQVRTTRTLQERVDALDASDPNWRLHALVESRPHPPAGKNSAELVVRVARMIPKGRPAPAVDEALADVEPPELLRPEKLKILDDELTVLAGAVAEARRLADMPEGRHELDLGPNPLMTLLQDQQDTRMSAQILRLDAWSLAQKKQTDAALLSARATVNAGRSLGEEPYAISQLIRVACISVGLSSMERSLALGEASDAELSKVQELLRLEDQHPTWRLIMRGERAVAFATIEGMLAGKIPVREALDMGPSSSNELTWREKIFGLTRTDMLRQQASLLDLFGEMSETGDLSETEQVTRLKEIEARIKTRYQGERLVRMLMPSMMQMEDAMRRMKAQVRCMDALVGAERYRVQTGKWPESLEAIPKALLPQAPIDPYDGKPLRLRRTADGIVVYSVGKDGVDQGGAVTRSPTNVLPVDQGFRLWDVAKRRQPPRPPAPKPDDNQPPGGPGEGPPGPPPGM
ncbi:MAG: hypothetical protein U0840_16880 [Gemmataceae bacterium]